MKNFILTFLLAVPAFLSAQDAPPTKFTWTKENGLTDFIVVPVEDKKASDMYTEALGWMIDRNDITSKKTVQGESIIIEGQADDVFCSTMMGMRNCNPLLYSIQVSFKDGKYKFDVLSINWKDKASNNIFPLEIAPPFTTTYYNKKGEIKSVFKWIENDLPAFLDKLSNEYKSRLTTKQDPKKNDW